jgi:hypothetical protein
LVTAASAQLVKQRVKLIGLTQSPQWNGRFGVALDFANGRYTVEIEGTSSRKIRCPFANVEGVPASPQADDSAVKAREAEEDQRLERELEQRRAAMMKLEEQQLQKEKAAAAERTRKLVRRGWARALPPCGQCVTATTAAGAGEGPEARRAAAPGGGNRSRAA